MSLGAYLKRGKSTFKPNILLSTIALLLVGVSLAKIIFVPNQAFAEKVAGTKITQNQNDQEPEGIISFISKPFAAFSNIASRVNVDLSDSDSSAKQSNTSPQSSSQSENNSNSNTASPSTTVSNSLSSVASPSPTSSTYVYYPPSPSPTNNPVNVFVGWPSPTPSPSPSMVPTGIKDGMVADNIYLSTAGGFGSLPDAKGSVKITVKKVYPSGFADVSLSGNLEKLQPNKVYKVWAYDNTDTGNMGGGTTNNNPEIRTDDNGNASFAGVDFGWNFAKYHIEQIRVYAKLETQADYQSNSCGSQVNPNPCLKGDSILFKQP